MSDLEPETLPKGRVTLAPKSVGETVRHLCDTSQLPAGPARDWLETDITELSARFSDLLDAKFIRLRLSVVTTNSCRKFHVDAIKARLICTYRGTGTQYGIAREDAQPDTVFTARTGAPVLLRGTRWLEQPRSGLVNHSPPIEGTGETRLVLVLDIVDDPDEL